MKSARSFGHWWRALACLTALSCGSGGSVGPDAEISIDGGNDAGNAEVGGPDAVGRADAADGAASDAAASDAAVSDAAVSDSVGDAPTTEASPDEATVADAPSPDGAAVGVGRDAPDDRAGDAGGTVAVTTLPVQANHLVYDPRARLIYASVPGAASSYANTIVFIDPATNAVVTSVPIGSDPDVLALSDDGSTLWVGLDGAQAMRKLILSSPPVAGPLVHPGSNAIVGRLLVLPGSATSVVASYSSSVGVFDDGVPRTTTSQDSSNALVAGPAGVVFGLASGLSVLKVSAIGVVYQPYGGLDRAGTIVYSNGRVYGDTGVVMDVMDLAAPTRLGQFPSSGAIALRDAQHLMMLTIDMTVPKPLAGPTLHFLATDDSFAQTGAVTLPISGASSSPVFVMRAIDLVYAGGDAVAFIMNDVIRGNSSVVVAHAPVVATGVGGGNDAGGDGGIRDAGGTGGPNRLTEFPLVTESATPLKLARGPEGNIWFTQLNNRIGRMSKSGVTTDFLVPTAGSYPFFIVAGPDGNMWFTENQANKVGRLSPTGTFTEFAAPAVAASPAGIAVGSDGNIWFTERFPSKIARMTPAGASTDFALPGIGSDPYGIAAGPDGNLWVTEYGASRIARVTTAGVITEFPISSGGPGSAIVAGPDGNLWFTQRSANVCRVSTAGATTCFPLPPDPNGIPPQLTGITVGPDGNLWASAFAASVVWRITPAGVATTVVAAGAEDILGGPDGNIWLSASNSMDRLSP